MLIFCLILFLSASKNAHSALDYYQSFMQCRPFPVFQCKWPGDLSQLHVLYIIATLIIQPAVYALHQVPNHAPGPRSRFPKDDGPLVVFYCIKE